MELYCKPYSALTRDELFEILRLRVAVFVVEQRCPYQEIDGTDRLAYHLWLAGADGPAAYLRLYPDPADEKTARIGRVIAAERRKGLGTTILKAGIEAAKAELGAERIVLEAQTYARGLYEKQGFRQISPEFLEDGIPHIRMELRFD